MSYRAILPCAGFGSRMGMSIDQSKEMLIDPNTSQPLIDYSLNICKKYDLDPVIISRKEKKDLNQYIVDKGLSLIVLPEVTGEWSNTVLKSSHMWGRYNILLFPDTKFEPISIIKEIKDSLELGANYSLGLHKVTDASKWCMVNSHQLIEKPVIDYDGYAFGILGFHKFGGVDLFHALEYKKKFDLTNTSFQYLTSFKDLTRAGKIE